MKSKVSSILSFIFFEATTCAWLRSVARPFVPLHLPGKGPGPFFVAGNWFIRDVCYPRPSKKTKGTNANDYEP